MEGLIIAPDLHPFPSQSHILSIWLTHSSVSGSLAFAISSTMRADLCCSRVSRVLARTRCSFRHRCIQSERVVTCIHCRVWVASAVSLVGGKQVATSIFHASQSSRSAIGKCVSWLTILRNIDYHSNHSSFEFWWMPQTQSFVSVPVSCKLAIAQALEVRARVLHATFQEQWPHFPTCACDGEYE